MSISTGPDFKKWSLFVFNPAGFVREVIGINPDPWQVRVLNAVAQKYPVRTSVRSCHGPGKTALLSWIVLWWLCTRPYPRVACTATSENQLLDKLWPEIHKWLRKSKGELHKWFCWEKSKVYLYAEPAEWFAVARTARVMRDDFGDEQSPGTQGWHNEHMLFLADEASGISDIVYAAMEGAISTGEDSKIVAMGNPNIPHGWFYESFNRNRSKWNNFKVSYLDSPRVKNKWAEDMVEMYGEDHPWVRVRVLGEFPKTSTDGLLTLDKIERCRERESAEGKVTIGVDVSTQSGTAKTIYAVSRGGRVTEISEIMGMELADLALEVYDLCMVHNADYVVVDSDGVGIGVVEPLARLLNSTKGDVKVPLLIKWHGSYSANRPKRYLNARAELCWKIKMDIDSASGGINITENENFDRQACAIKFFVESENKGKIRIASKKEIYKLIKESPDEFDAVTYSLVPFVYKDDGIPINSDDDISGSEFVL